MRAEPSVLLSARYRLLLGDQQRPHELIVFVIEDVAMLDVAGAVRRVEREVVRSGDGAARGARRRRPAQCKTSDLTREHLDRVLPTSVDGFRSPVGACPAGASTLE